MQHSTIRCAIAAVFFVVAQGAGAVDQPKPVKVYVDGLPKNVAEQVKKHGEQGEAALKKYLQDTQKMHHLRYEDVTQPRMQPVSDGGAMQKEPKKHATDYR